MSKFTGMSVLDLTRQGESCENSKYDKSFSQPSSFTCHYLDSSPENNSRHDDWMFKKRCTDSVLSTHSSFPSPAVGGNDRSLRNHLLNAEEERKYRELRDRNNLAAQICRSKKKQKDYAEKQKIVSLREENAIIKKALSCCTCHQPISRNRCNFCPSTNLAQPLPVYYYSRPITNL